SSGAWSRAAGADVLPLRSGAALLPVLLVFRFMASHPALVVRSQGRWVAGKAAGTLRLGPSPLAGRGTRRGNSERHWPIVLLARRPVVAPKGRGQAPSAGKDIRPKGEGGGGCGGQSITACQHPS